MMKLIVLKDTFSNLDVLNAKDDCILEIKKAYIYFKYTYMNEILSMGILYVYASKHRMQLN